MGLKKKDQPPKAQKPQKAPRYELGEGSPAPAVSKVAAEITTLVETANKAEALTAENASLTEALTEATKAASDATSLANAYATEAAQITEQDLQNLVTIRARISFGEKFTKGVLFCLIEGTGRRRVKVRGKGLVDALIALRPLMAKVPGGLKAAPEPETPPEVEDSFTDEDDAE